MSASPKKFITINGVVKLNPEYKIFRNLEAAEATASSISNSSPVLTSLSLYPEYVLCGNLSPGNYGTEVDKIVQEIENATKGFGANKQRVIDALATQNPTQRAKISARYMEMYGRDHKKFRHMGDLMKKEFSGDFRDVMLFLALPSHQAECAMIRRATKGAGANAKVVWSIVCGRTNEEMRILKQTYLQMYESDLGNVLESELRGGIELLTFLCLQATEEKFDPSYHTMDKVRKNAEIIHNNGQNKMGTDVKGTLRVICAAPPDHLASINMVYAQNYGSRLEKKMERELGGMGEKGLDQAVLYEIGMKLNPFQTMARLIDSACRGFGTDELLLTCCLVRFQPYLAKVMKCFLDEYGKTIHDVVRSEVGGDYRKVLLQILHTACPEPGLSNS